MLTKRQKEILDFIESFSLKYGYSPTLEEIAKHLGVSSVGTIHEHLKKLELKKYVKLTGQPRGIGVVDTGSMVDIPLLGLIAAGEPIEAISNPGTVAVARSMISKRGSYYALEVQGDSMATKDGIFNGDIVIIRNQSTINDGEIAVAYLPDRNEATLKKIYKTKNAIKLQPANPAYKPIMVKNVNIQGRVVGVIRKI
ncbi:MAG: transcriptional repressor LexA [Parcubacteria group bacterium]